MELTRRLILLAGVTLALWTAKLAYLAPLVSVEATDFARLQEKESRWTERGQYLAQLPAAAYVEARTKNRRFEVAGNEWSRFFQDVLAASRGESSDHQWMARIGADERRWRLLPYRLFFRPKENPLAKVAGTLLQNQEEIFLALREKDNAAYLTLRRHRYTNDDFLLGSGFSATPRPPAAFLFPFRSYSLWLALLGLAAYILLPRRRRPKEAIHYAGWRIALGDFAAMLLFTMFFALPLFIIGGSLQVFSRAWPLALVLWPLAFVGVWLLRFNAWMASYEILPIAGGIEICTYKGKKSFPLDAMEAFQPLVLKAPRWLVILSWLAALAGRGRQRLNLAGQALLLGSSAANGIGVRMRNGSSIFFWLSDQLGGQALKNARNLPVLFEKAGIPRLDEAKVIESITLPTGEDAQGRRNHEGSGRALAVLLLLPVAAMVAFSLVLLFGRGHAANEAGIEKTEAATARTPDENAAWSVSIGQGEMVLGNAVIRTPDGSFLVAGSAMGQSTDLDFLLAKVDAAGKVQWEKTYARAYRQYGLFACLASDGGFFILGETRSPADTLGGGSDVLLVRTDSAGDRLWEKAWGQGEQDEVPLALAAGANGSCRILVRTPASVDMVAWNADGNVSRHEKHVLLAHFEEPENIRAAAFTADGGFVLTGEERKQGARYVDLFLARFSASGKLDWKRIAGGPGKESGAAVLALRNGGFAAAGTANAFDENGENLYLLSTNAQGEVLGERVFGRAGDQSAAALVEMENGDVLILGSEKKQGAPAEIYLVTITSSWAEHSEKRMAGGPHGAEGAALVPAGDGTVVIVANRTLSWMGGRRIELITIAKK